MLIMDLGNADPFSYLVLLSGTTDKHTRMCTPMNFCTFFENLNK